jgi:hypothetical protein
MLKQVVSLFASFLYDFLRRSLDCQVLQPQYSITREGIEDKLLALIDNIDRLVDRIMQVSMACAIPDYPYLWVHTERPSWFEATRRICSECAFF